MRVLVIGGTKFIGPLVVARLGAAGHEVTLFNRGRSGRADIAGDRKKLAKHADGLRALEPDVVLDMIPMTEADARGLVEVFDAVRLVAISSGDVYRAFGRVNGLEKTPVEPGPLAEDAPLRTVRYPYREQYPEYDKIPVEECVLAAGGCVLRLPMVYGPGDPQHRFRTFIRAMDGGEPEIVLQEDFAAWRMTYAYVENVAVAIVAAVERAAPGAVYNVGDEEALATIEWVRLLGASTGWSGKIVTLPKERCPEDLRREGFFAQHVEMDSTRVRRELGVTDPVDRAEALQRTVEYERAQPPDA